MQTNAGLDETRPTISETQYRELAARFELLWSSPDARVHGSELAEIVSLIDAYEEHRD